MTPPIEGSAGHTFLPEAASAVADQIRQAGGVEVFFIGRRGPDGLVRDVESRAYGSPTEVPVAPHDVRPGDVIIHNHPSGGLTPSSADINVASTFFQMGVGFYIVTNDCTQVRVVTRPHDEKKKTPIDPVDVERLLGPGSPIAQALGAFEDRPQQRRMARSVVDAFNGEGIAVVEAGTGTGKSLAYLVPALLYAMENREKVVVSTRTINLQEQILNKDLPLVKSALARDFTAELVKGRSNYVCKRKAAFARDELSQPQQLLIPDETTRELRDLLEWVATSPTGDRGELPVSPGHEAWERVMSEADNCLRVRCPFYNECFFYTARRRAARADILVVNHSLLMSDLAVRRETKNWDNAAVLPPYQHVILDEAHHLEEVATEHLGSTVARGGIRRLLGRLYRTDSRGQHGVIAALRRTVEHLVAKHVLPTTTDLVQRVSFDLPDSIETARDAAEAHLDEFAWGFLQVAGLDPPRRGIEHKVRLLPAHATHPDWHPRCEDSLRALATTLAETLSIHRAALEEVGNLGEECLDELLNVAMEWRALVDRLDRTRLLIGAFLRHHPSVCRWVEIMPDKRDRLGLRLCQAPISVADALRETLHTHLRTEVLTSATLAIDGSFDFLFERAGIMPPDMAQEDEPIPILPTDRGGMEDVPHASFDEFEEEQRDEAALNPLVRDAPRARPLESLVLDTPFDFASQAFFGVATDLGDPRGGGFDDKLEDFILRAVSISQGRALVLFTSAGQMRRLHERCAPVARRMGFACHVQGQEARDILLRRFREDETSILFATASFWEGVDVRGRALELLILARLPFAVPSEPIQEAQYESLQAQGRDPFTMLSIPRAVIRFKQGFGRLIRSRTDRGAVLVADERLVRMNYGKRFLRSLPPVAVHDGPGTEVLEKMRGFFEGF
jgi:ATP-dependent DNA helicase DinG